MIGGGTRRAPTTSCWIAMALFSLTRWFQRPAPPAPPAPPAAPAPTATTHLPAALEARVARWLASESPALVALALESVRRLTKATPRSQDEPPTAGAPAWLGPTLDRLEALPEPLPVPPQAPGLAWRYLVLMRLLGDALEAAYTAAWRQGVATGCPLTDAPDENPAPRGQDGARERARRQGAGLAALIAGTRLPLAGQRHLYAAQVMGVDWSDSTAFWACVRAAGAQKSSSAAADTGIPASEPESPGGATGTSLPEAGRLVTDAATLRPVSLPDVPGEPQASARASVAPPRLRHPATSLPDATPPAAAGSSPPDPHRAPLPDVTTDPWNALARTALATLVASPRFNQPAGVAWFYDGVFYVAAKAFAETLQHHAWIAAQPELRDRKAIYRQLLMRCLILPEGARPVWHLLIIAPSATEPRYVSALKMAPALAAGLTPCPAFSGVLRPGTAAAMHALKSAH